METPTISIWQIMPILMVIQWHSAVIRYSERLIHCVYYWVYYSRVCFSFWKHLCFTFFIMQFITIHHNLSGKWSWTWRIGNFVICDLVAHRQQYICRKKNIKWRAYKMIRLVVSVKNHSVGQWSTKQLILTSLQCHSITTPPPHRNSSASQLRLNHCCAA